MGGMVSALSGLVLGGCCEYYTVRAQSCNMFHVSLWRGGESTLGGWRAVWCGAACRVVVGRYGMVGTHLLGFMGMPELNGMAVTDCRDCWMACSQSRNISLLPLRSRDGEVWTGGILCWSLKT